MAAENKSGKVPIDALINKIAYNLVYEINNKNKDKKKKYLNEIDKSLGVLSNDGVYAYFVYVESKNINDVFLDQIRDITNIVKVRSEGKLINELNQNYFQKLSEDLNSLLFFRDILEKILIYARYHAKALGEKNE